MQWTDANVEAHERNMARGTRGPDPITDINYRSECNRYRVTVADLHTPAEARTWIVWDMTLGQPAALADGFKSSVSAMRAAEAMAESRGFRVALRLAAIGRAVWAGVRRLTA
jgi:hypothetical protein